MKISALVGILMLAASSYAGAQVDQLYGTWRLLSWVRQSVDTGERLDTFGKAPSGYLSLGRDGRMLVLIVRENRPKPTDLTKMTDQERADLFKSMIAYGGTFKLEGSRFVTDVDISWNENWTGTKQPRNFKIEGDRLILSADPAPGVDGKRVSAVLTWQKVQ